MLVKFRTWLLLALFVLFRELLINEKHNIRAIFVNHNIQKNNKVNQNGYYNHNRSAASNHSREFISTFVSEHDFPGKNITALN